MRREVIYSADGGSYRVVRGGSWLDAVRYVRASNRYGSDPGLRDVYLGFRCVRKS